MAPVPPPSVSAVRVTALRAKYPGGKEGESKEALRGLNLEVKPGRIFALLGPNGAGKTTLLRCLTGLMQPVSGTVQILGATVGERFAAARLRRMGVLLESPGCYDRLTVAEYLNFFAGFYFPGSPAQRMVELAEAFELESLSVRVGKLSQGNRRKVQLMRSVLHSPALVLWDEPTEHLDPGAQRKALEFLRGFVADGAAALITSHRLEQMEDLADDYGFLRQGRIVHTLSRDDLGAAIEAAVLEGEGALDHAELQAGLKQWGAQCEAMTTHNGHTQRWRVQLHGAEAAAALPELIATVVRSGGRVLRAEPRRLSLEDLYRRHVEISPAEAG